jgi:hypothetical protein
VTWLEPNVLRDGCGRYGGYFGKIGSFSTLKLNCTTNQLWNDTAANRANANANAGWGIGAVPFWLGGGPGADPEFDGTISTAYDWGKRQGRAALEAADSFPVKTPIMFFDVEEPNHSAVPHSYYGWNEKVEDGTCADLDPDHGSEKCCSPALARATFNGFWDYIESNVSPYRGDSYAAGVYSTANTWNSIFEGSSDGILYNTMEWTANWGGGCINPGPYDWTQSAGNCASHSAEWFADIPSQCRLVWQWHGGSEDYDQINTNNLFKCK